MSAILHDRSGERSGTPAEPAIAVEGLGKRYLLGARTGVRNYKTLREALVPGRRKEQQPSREFWAVRDLSFSLGQGEILGIIGRNGAGKSTLLKLLSRVTAPTTGTAAIRGRVGSLLEVGTGFHPELSGRENILLNGAILGMGRSEFLAKFDEIVDFAGVERFIDTPVKRYSSGMYLRLAFAVAAHLEPEILLVDEVLAVGDAEFQKKCLGRMGEIGESGRTVVFISHSMPAMLRLCPRLLLLNQGQLVQDGPAADVIRTYLDSGLGSSAERHWEPEDAPGDEIMRLRSIRLRDEAGRTVDEVDVRDRVAVEVVYEHTGEDPAVRPSLVLSFRNDDGVFLFHSHDFVNQQWAAADRQRGRVTATCWVPGNFLAEGRLMVDVGASSYVPSRQYFQEYDVLSFQVVDHSTGDGVRGLWTGEWPGVVRPMLDWQVSVSPADS